MRRTLGHIARLIRREMRIMSRDADILIIALIAPLFYSLFYASLYIQKGEQDVAMVIVDMDHSHESRMLIRDLDAHPHIRVTDELSGMNEAEQSLCTASAYGIVYIPRGFEAGIKTGTGTTIAALLNTTRFLVSNDMNKGITDVVLAHNAALRVRFLSLAGFSPAQAAGLSEPVRAEIRPMFNTTETYGDFLIPAIFVIILQQAFFIALGESIGLERESGSISEWHGAIRERALTAFAGKAGWYLLIFGAHALFFFTVLPLAFTIPMHGSGFALAIISLLFLLAVAAIGTFIATFFKRKIIALQVLGFTSYPIFLTTGYSWPMQAVPIPLKAVASCFPMTPFLAAFTRVTQMGATVADVSIEVFHLLALFIGGALLVRWRFRRMLDPTALGA